MGEVAPILETKSVTRKFGGLTALNNVSISMAPREIRAIIGPNGAGKTTLIKIIAGDIKPTSGNVVFKGEDITGLPPPEIARKGIALCFQITNVFPNLTVFENVWVSCFQRCERSKGPLTKLRDLLSDYRGLVDVRDSVEDVLRVTDLEKRRDVKASALSHGERRLLEVALALGLDPVLLLLDEPTAGLGSKDIPGIVRLIENLHEQREVTVLVIEHKMSVVMKLAQMITVLHLGEKIAEGTPDAISGNEAVQAVYLGKR